MRLYLNSAQRQVLREYPKSLNAEAINLNISVQKFNREFAKTIRLPLIVEKLNKLLSK